MNTLSNARRTHARVIAHPAALQHPASASRSDFVALLDQSSRWASFAQERTSQQPGTLHKKALDAARFSADVGARSLTVPSKLVGTSRHQDAVCVLVAHLNASGHSGRGVRLEVTEEAGALFVSFSAEGKRYRLGRVQHKHVGWLRPLLYHGAEVYLLQVTGLEREDATLGVNVAFGHVGAALVRIAAPFSTPLTPTVAETPASYHAVPPLTLVREGSRAPAYSPALPTTPQPHHLATHHFVAFGRDRRGALVVVTPLGRTFTVDDDGIEFGYRGAGPHRLARLLLSALGLDEEQVEALAHDLVLDCIEGLPRYHTTILSMEHFRRWVEHQHEARRAA